jgi:hypothetical protein
MLRALVNRWLTAWLEQRKLLVLYRVDGIGVGDTLVMSAWMRRAHERHGFKYFENNPLVDRNIDFRGLGSIRKPIAKWLLKKAGNERIFQFGYFGGKEHTREEFMQAASRPVSLIQLYSEHIPYPIDYDNACNEVFLTTAETTAYSRAFSKLFDHHKTFVLIRPVGFTRWTTKKEWRIERYQAVVNLFPHHQWVQIGDANDPLLENTIDLRGKTSLRELAWVISKAQLMLCGEGVYNHLASAFNTPTVVVQSGFTPPELACYPTTIIVARKQVTDCSPCLLPGLCHIKGKPCTNDISVAMVAEALTSSIALTRSNLQKKTA